MQTVLLVIHLMVIVALVGVVLLQRSEGGALGIGGGGGFMTSRGTANVLTRTTAILAGLFFLTSLGLSILPRVLGTQQSILENVTTTEQPKDTQPGTPIGDGKGGVLNQLNDLIKKNQDNNAASQPANVPVAPAVEVPAVPTDTAPAATSPAASAPAEATPAPADAAAPKATDATTANDPSPAAPADTATTPAAPAPAAQ